MPKNTRKDFWKKVRKTASCWIWEGTLAGYKPRLYGQFWMDGRVHMAHRFAYEDKVAPIPEGLTIDHLCRNTRCVNPDHLEPVTITTNILRGFGKGAINARKTHCKHGHPLSGDNLFKRPDGHRGCRTCHRAQVRRSKSRKRGGVDRSFGKRTHCPRGHPYTGTNLRIKKGSGHRICKTCARWLTYQRRTGRPHPEENGGCFVRGKGGWGLRAPLMDARPTVAKIHARKPISSPAGREGPSRGR